MACSAQSASTQDDPETAEVRTSRGSLRDPHGVCDLTYEQDCYCKNDFARAPGHDVWVLFDDLPEATRDRLSARVRAEAAARERQEAVARDDLPF
jgi:hypothetical protein